MANKLIVSVAALMILGAIALNVYVIDYALTRFFH